MVDIKYSKDNWGCVGGVCLKRGKKELEELGRRRRLKK